MLYGTHEDVLGSYRSEAEIQDNDIKANNLARLKSLCLVQRINPEATQPFKPNSLRFHLHKDAESAKIIYKQVDSQSESLKIDFDWLRHFVAVNAFASYEFHVHELHVRAVVGSLFDADNVTVDFLLSLDHHEGIKASSFTFKKAHFDTVNGHWTKQNHCCLTQNNFKYNGKLQFSVNEKPCTLLFNHIN